VDRRRVTIFLIVLVNFIGSTIVIPVLPLYAQGRFGASPPLISLLYASFFIAQFLASPLLGRLSDRYGRRPVLLLSQLGTAFSFLLMALAGALPLLFAARILDGITGGNVIVAQAYLTDITTREQRTRALGATWAAFGIGLAFGGLIGGVLTHFLGERAPFIAGMTMALATALLTWRTLPETLTPELRAQRIAEGRRPLAWGEIRHSRPLLLILLIGFLAQWAMMLFQSTWALYGEAVLFDAASASLWVGVLLAMLGIWQFLTQFLLIKPLLARFGEHGLLIMGALLRALAMFTFVLLPFPLTVGVFGMVGFAVGSGIMMPSLQSLATTSGRPEVSGAVLGVYQSATTLGIITGAVSSGFLFARSPFLPYLMGGALLLLTLLPSILLLRMAPTRTAEAY
jgi:DHA1 family tetracycline resistance protein-like MFS transporter